jgi:ubiquinol-cytochrome c reductase iron-sulfur subunit
MNEQGKVDKTRRTLVVATSLVGGAAGVGAAVPFVASMWPSERAKAAGAPVSEDIANLQPGELRIVEWRGKPVWVMKRTKEMLESIKQADSKVTDPQSKVSSQQPDYAKNEFRSATPDLMVLVGVCTHLGCSPKPKSAEDKAEMGADWGGGFYCPCHGSKFDLAGRVYKGSPAPINLEVPKYTLAGSMLTIGVDKESKGA